MIFFMKADQVCDGNYAQRFDRFTDVPDRCQTVDLFILVPRRFSGGFVFHFEMPVSVDMLNARFVYFLLIGLPFLFLFPFDRTEARGFFRSVLHCKTYN